MPSRSEHIAKAEANEQVAQFLQATHPDWAVTALFYAAVHWVDAVLDGLDGRSIHPQLHTQRRGQIARQLLLSAVELEYRILQDASVAARYDCEFFYPSDAAYIRQVSFEPVRDVCKPLLGIP